VPVRDTPVVDTALLAALRADLAAADFTLDAVAASLGPVAVAELRREQGLPADLATRDRRDPLSVLLRLFTLGRPVAAHELDTVLPTLGTDGLLRLRLATREGRSVRATCDLRPPRRRVPRMVTLAAWTVRRGVERALDLGTGCGVQALHLASHSRTLVATDVSQRALDYARFNAALAGLELGLRRGSLLEPVAGERFDLIVSNPPFVITPRVEGVPLFEYRDGGLVGDGIVERLVRSVGDHLSQGGVAQFLGNWEIRAGATWRDRWGKWLTGTGLDAWVIQREVQDPAEYAELWARDGGSHGGTEGFEQLYAAWLADFAARDVVGIGFGVVALQRPTSDRLPWVDLVEATGPVAPAMGGPGGRGGMAGMGGTVDAGLAARTWLAEQGEAGLLDTAWRCAADVTEERHTKPGTENPDVILVRQGGGLRRSIPVDTVIAGLVSVCDGSLTARQAFEAIAGLLELEAGAVIASALPTLRALVADGLLVRD